VASHLAYARRLCWLRSLPHQGGQLHHSANSDHTLGGGAVRNLVTSCPAPPPTDCVPDLRAEYPRTKERCLRGATLHDARSG
jgi:hypothetical protein